MKPGGPGRRLGPRRGPETPRPARRLLRLGGSLRRRLALARGRLGTRTLRLARVEHLDLREGFGDLGAGSLVDQVDDRTHRLDAHARLLEIALVILRDPARGEVEDADHALEQ